MPKISQHRTAINDIKTLIKIINRYAPDDEAARAIGILLKTLRLVKKLSPTLVGSPTTTVEIAGEQRAAYSNVPLSVICGQAIKLLDEHKDNPTSTAGSMQ